MFLFGLQRWISPHSPKIRANIVFSVTPEILANHSLPAGSITPRVFYICGLHWLYPPSMEQRRNCFLPCSSLQFSLLPEKTHFSCVSPQVFPFPFCKHRKILHKPNDFVGSLHIEFATSNLPSRGPGPFHCISHMSVVLYRLLYGVHIFGF